MPCLEETPRKYSEIIIEPNPTIPAVTNNNVANEMSSLEVKHDDEQEVVRELTQTDRLNNRLLKSLLDHMNNGGANKFVTDNLNDAPENSFTE